jgi:TRAP transporter TAXI family solute receptor
MNNLFKKEDKKMTSKISMKIFILFFTGLLALSLLPDPAHSETARSGWPAHVTFADGRPGSAAFATFTGMSTLVTKYVRIKAVPESGAAGKNLILLHKGEAEFGYSLCDTAQEAGRGLGEFKKYGPMKLRLLWHTSGPAPMAFVVRADSGIKKIEDLKGKKVMGIYPANPTYTRIADILLEAVGMTRNDIQDMTYAGRGEATPALKEGRISAWIQALPSRGLPSWIQEMSLTHPVRLITAPEEKLDRVLSKYSFLVKCKLSAETYKDIIFNKDMTTISTPMILLANSELPDDFVYAVTKAIFEHVPELLKFHPEAKLYVDDPLGTKAVLPYHPGVIKYFKEKGTWTKELEDAQAKLLKEVGASK